MEETKLNLSAPWFEFVRQVKVLFAKDPAIRIDFDAGALKLKLYVRGSKKAYALAKLLPQQKIFGNVVLDIIVITDNENESDNPAELLRDAFEGNPVLSGVVTVPNITTNRIIYAIFNNSTVQYWNDNLSDANGIVTTIYESIVPSVLDLPKGVMCCTEPGDDIIRG